MVPQSVDQISSENEYLALNTFFIKGTSVFTISIKCNSCMVFMTVMF